jgi:hypothetical protein
MLGRIDTDPDNLAHGRLPSFETFDSLTLALDAVGGPSTPTIQCRLRRRRFVVANAVPASPRLLRRYAPRNDEAI